ncbi:MAG TPA: inositol monophosphatase family protein [Thermoanaerobaculia bacterium]|jgi:myo-inositol-1(or 4)-monophosphatase|nr:inositol monophosphatase family protein [Thermoanaerobaculia bacterium]
MHDELLATAVAAAHAGAEVITRYFRGADLDVRRKAENDFVTRADRESEAAVLAVIRQRFPDHRILAEEGSGAGEGHGDYEWLIDPLDGTTNFLQGLPVYCVSIACRRGDELLAGAIEDPEGHNLFTAVRGGGAFWNGRPMQTSRRDGLDGAFLATGYPFRALSTLDIYLAIFRDVFRHAKAIRRCGSAALDLAYTAAGVYDGFFEFRLSPWDIGAGMLMVREAGGIVTDLDGGDGSFGSGNIVAGSPAVHRGLLEIVRQHASEEAIERVNPILSPAVAGP